MCYLAFVTTDASVTTGTRPTDARRVPAGAAVFSAWGMMMSDLRRDYFVTKLADLKTGAGANEVCVVEPYQALLFRVQLRFRG